MWKRAPDRQLVHEWIDRALEDSEAESPARAKALIARATIVGDDAGAAARRASRLADRLGDDELRSWAWGARSFARRSRETTTRRRSAGRSRGSNSRRTSTILTTFR